MARIKYLLDEDTLTALERVKADAMIAEYARKGVRVLPAHAKKLRERGMQVKRA